MSIKVYTINAYSTEFNIFNFVHIPESVEFLILLLIITII